MKRAIPVGLLVLLAAYAAGCGNGNDSGAPAAGSGGTADTGGAGGTGGSIVSGGQGGGGTGGSAGIVGGSGGTETGGNGGIGGDGGTGAATGGGAGTDGGQPCSFGEILCGGECFNPKTDSDHCGDCQTACSPDRYCDNGHCVCSESRTTCGTECVDIRSSDSCGGCGTKCGPGQICAEDPAYPGYGFYTCQCPPRTVDCNGTCVRADASNCGLCGNACPEYRYCLFGDTCVGEWDCTHSSEELCADGTCRDGFSTMDCGACGVVCDPPLTCNNDSCGCPASTPDPCDGMCVDFQSDPAHCGSCERACPGAITCENGQCTCPSVAPDLCDGDCTNVQTDQKNCGMCGHACDAGMGWYCSSGSCVQGMPPTCEAHYELATCFEWLGTLGYTMYVCTGSAPPSGLSCLLYYSDHTNTWAYCCK